MWNPHKMLLLHNTRETLARLLNSRILDLCTTYKAKMQRLLSQVCYMYGIPMIWSKMIEYDNLNVVWCYGSFLWDLCLSFPLCLKAWMALSLLSSFLMQNFTNRDSNCVFAMTTLWHKRWYQDMHHNNIVWMLWEVWSLMCTSYVAGNTQRLVSMGKLRKMGYGGYQCNGKE